MQSLAAVLRDVAQPFTIESVDVGEPRAGEVLVRTVSAGMCHTDLLPRHGFAVATPIILGHEGAGFVEAVGPGVTNVKPGDHVVLSFNSCGECVQCLSAHPALCPHFGALNFAGVRSDGSTSVTGSGGEPIAARWFGQSSFATNVIAAERTVVKVTDDVPLETLAPLGCGVLTGAGAVLNSLDVQPASSIAVFGAGTVGLAAVMAAKVAGATRIVAVDRHHQRLELAGELGATHVITAGDASIRDDVSATGGSVDYAIDTTGVISVITAALDVVGPGGTLGMIAGPMGALTFGRTAFFGKRAIGIIEGDSVPQTLIPRLIVLWRAGQFPFDRLISEFPFEAIDDAEKAAASGEVIKPVLRMPV